MRTTKDERDRWGPELLLMAADMEEAEIDDILAFARDLIADVDEAVKLIVKLYNNAPSADEFRLMVRTMGRTTEAAEGLMPQIDRLADTEAEVVDFLKEPDA